MRNNFLFLFFVAVWQLKITKEEKESFSWQMFIISTSILMVMDHTRLVIVSYFSVSFPSEKLMRLLFCYAEDSFAHPCFTIENTSLLSLYY